MNMHYCNTNSSTCICNEGAGDEDPQVKAELDDLVVRAHYLALDLRIAATSMASVDTDLTRLTSEFLRHWAVTTGNRGQYEAG